MIKKEKQPNRLEAGDITAREVTTLLEDAIVHEDPLKTVESVEALDTYEADVRKKIDAIMAEPNRFGTFLSRLQETRLGKLATILLLAGELLQPVGASATEPTEETTVSEVFVTEIQEEIDTRLETIAVPVSTIHPESITVPVDTAREYQEQYGVDGIEQPDVRAAASEITAALADATGDIIVTITGYSSFEGRATSADPQDIRHNEHLSLQRSLSAEDALHTALVDLGVSDVDMDRIQMHTVGGGERYQMVNDAGKVEHFNSEVEIRDHLIDVLSLGSNQELDGLIEVYNDGEAISPIAADYLGRALYGNRVSEARLEFETAQEGVEFEKVQTTVEVPVYQKVRVLQDIVETDSRPEFPKKEAPILARKMLISKEEEESFDPDATPPTEIPVPGLTPPGTPEGPFDMPPVDPITPENPTETVPIPTPELPPTLPPNTPEVPPTDVPKVPVDTTPDIPPTEITVTGTELPPAQPPEITKTPNEIPPHAPEIGDPTTPDFPLSPPVVPEVPTGSRVETPVDSSTTPPDTDIPPETDTPEEDSNTGTKTDVIDSPPQEKRTSSGHSSVELQTMKTSVVRKGKNVKHVKHDNNPRRPRQAEIDTGGATVKLDDAGHAITTPRRAGGGSRQRTETGRNDHNYTDVPATREELADSREFEREAAMYATLGGDIDEDDALEEYYNRGDNAVFEREKQAKPPEEDTIDYQLKDAAE